MLRSRALWLLCSASLLACRREPEAAPAAAPPPPSSPLEWSAEAPGGRVMVRQVPAGSGCRLSGHEGGGTRWTTDACAGTQEDLHFVSPDGDRLLVLVPLPDGVRGKDWSEAIVARTFFRGTEERRIAGAELVAASSIADMSRSYSWVKGVGSGGGIAPRYAEGGGGVVLDVVDGATLRLGFDGSGAPGRSAPATATRTAPAGAAGPAPALPPEEARPLPSREADETTLWRWEDAQGGVHYSHWGAVPAASRRKAERVTASVGSVGGGGGGGGLRGSALPSASGGREPAPSIHDGPRLNGLTDGERHEQELKRLEAERAKNASDAVLYERQRAMERTIDEARARGFGRY